MIRNFIDINLIMANFNPIDASVWANYLEYTSAHVSDANHGILAITGQDIVYLPKERIQQIGATKLSTENIIEITESLFERNIQIHEKEKMVRGLSAIIRRRQQKFENLNSLCNYIAYLFGEETTSQRLHSKVTILSTRYQEELTEFEQQRRLELERLEQQRQKELRKQEERIKVERLLKQLPDSFSDINGIDLTELDGLSPKRVEFLADKLSETLNTNDENATTLFLIYEKAAERFIAKAKVPEAVRVRIKAAQSLKCSPSFNKIHPYIRTNASAPFGCKVSPLGTTVLKNHVLHGQIRNNGQYLRGLKFYTYLEGKLNHYVCKKIESINTPTFLQALTEYLPRNFCQEVTMEGNDANNKFSINFKGVGSIQINGTYCSYNRVVIKMDSSLPPDETGSKIYLMLAALGLGDIAHVQRPVDVERIKIFQLFRAYFPKEAFHFERSQAAFEMPLTALREGMLKSLTYVRREKKERISDIFNKFTSTPNLMYQQEIYPGYGIWAVKGLSDEIASKGAVGLMIGVGTARVDRYAGVVLHPFEKTANDVVSMLKNGILSTEDRLRIGLREGISPGEDIRCGGGDSVFTRMVLKKWLKQENDSKSGVKIKGFHFHGHIQLLIDIKLLDRVGYGFEHDYYGAKTTPPRSFDTPYEERKNLIDLAVHLHDQYSGEEGNEICIKNRIPPEYVIGMQVATEKSKDYLVTLFKEKGLIVSEGTVDKIMGVPLDQFFHVGDKFTPASFRIKL